MSDNVEPRVRRLVAEYLGVDPDELAADVSLTDDLAADSLDLLELAIVLEGQFGIVIPESLLDDVHRYGDLVDAVTTLSARHQPFDDVTPVVWARVVSGAGSGVLARAGELTPYTAEDIAADALHAGPGAHLEMSVPTDTSDRTIARLANDFAWLETRGVQVSVRRDRTVDPAGKRPHPHAA